MTFLKSLIQNELLIDFIFMLTGIINLNELKTNNYISLYK